MHLAWVPATASTPLLHSFFPHHSTGPQCVNKARRRMSHSVLPHHSRNLMGCTR
ncbi:S-isoprenylcysteine O-methyltransferase [Acetobacter orientalis]|uniref:S-isoprenylcysteine O-methyltransferase n=1 Tax=Acetobacter orientalis TaxID=146474 RepID=A0A2Z5ZK06_9PROT|nr:S-isoprenylcysteine O-methyltransferase [Acetobacter orientalis]